MCLNTQNKSVKYVRYVLCNNMTMNFSYENSDYVTIGHQKQRLYVHIDVDD